MKGGAGGQRFRIMVMGGDCSMLCALMMGMVRGYSLLHNGDDAVPIPHGGCGREVTRVFMDGICLWRTALRQYGGGDEDFTEDVAKHG